MFAKALVVVLLAVCVGAQSSRVRRQGFSWGEGEDSDEISSRPPTTTSSSVVRPNGSTTTTETPEYRQCLATCPTTSEYNPVCGSNRVTYRNNNLMRCAVQCGLTVTMVFDGACSPL